MPDERVAAAIQHWAPRFVTNGVDFNDFRRVTGERRFHKRVIRSKLFQCGGKITGQQGLFHLRIGGGG